MAKRSRQTFKKRQREMAREQKRQDKARRIAARKAGSTADGFGGAVGPASAEATGGKPTLRIVAIGRSAPASDRK